MKVCDMPKDERPQARAERYGMGALSTAELLQVICRNHNFDSNMGLVQAAGSVTALARMSLQEKAAVPGLGKAGALAIEASFELGRRVLMETPADKIRVRSPSDVAQMLMAQYANEPQEHFVVLVLSTRNDLVATVDLYKGTLNCSHVRASEVFHEAIVRNGAAIILVHNHPSGDPTPSPEDVEVTRQMVAASNLLDIEVLDHLIIGQQRYISLRERGLGFDL